jgi:hypothetical protein
VFSKGKHGQAATERFRGAARRSHNGVEAKETFTMKSEKVEVSAANNIIVQVSLLDSDYEVEWYTEANASKHGLLVLLHLRPNPDTANLPSFKARWDTNDDIMAIDLERPENDQLAFKEEQKGYKGHYPKRIDSDNVRVFQIRIQIPPAKVIYVGKVTCSLIRKLRLPLSAEAGMAAAGEVIRPGQPAPPPNAPRA